SRQWCRDAVDGKDDRGVRSDQRNRAGPHFAAHRRRVDDGRYHWAALPVGRIRGGQVLLGRPDNAVRYGCWNIAVEMPDLLSGGEFAGLTDEQADAFAERFGGRGEPQLPHDVLQCGHLIGRAAARRSLGGAAGGRAGLPPCRCSLRRLAVPPTCSLRRLRRCLATSLPGAAWVRPGGTLLSYRCHTASMPRRPRPFNARPARRPPWRLNRPGNSWTYRPPTARLLRPSPPQPADQRHDRDASDPPRPWYRRRRRRVPGRGRSG